MNKRSKTYINKQDGFTLWELSIVMLIMIGLFVALVNIMPYIVKRENIEFDKQIIVKVDEQIVGFVATYSRLPCPDNDADGLENCGSNSGLLPYKTLGLNEDYAGIGSIPLKYAVFRNSAASADLTTITNLFNPTDSHGTVTTQNVINGLDFCTALSNGKASTFSSSFAHIVLPTGTMVAVPYVIVTAGLSNADGLSTTFDGRNSNSTMDFEAPNRTHNSSYDDTVFSKSFDELASTLNCDTAQNSLNLLADAKATHTENLTQAQSIKEAAELAIIITIMQTALGIANTAMAVYNLALAVALVVVAAGSLASAIATCIASLGTACALVGVAIAGLVAAIAGVIAAGISVGLNVAALVLQTIAIVKTIDVANRAGSAISVPNPNNSTNTTGPTTTNSDLAAQVRAEATTLRLQVADKTIKARDDINASISQAITVRNRFIDIKNKTQTLANTNTAVNDALFSSYSNAANAEAQLAINRANTALSNLQSAKIDADNAVAALGTAPNYTNINFTAVRNNLQLAEPKMTAALNQFTVLSNDYLNIKTQSTNARNRIIAIRNALTALPNNATQAQIIARTAYLAVLNDAENKANTIINTMNVVVNNPFDLRNRLEVEIGVELGRIQGAQSATTEALKTIEAAIDADANATYMENNVGGANPPPTTTTLNLSTGVDAILLEANRKGVER